MKEATETTEATSTETRNNRRNKHDRYLSEPEEHGYNFDNLVEIEGVLEVQPRRSRNIKIR